MPLNLGLRRRTGSVAIALNSHRLFFYSLLSIFAVSAVILNALRSYSNIYSVAISLSKSNRSVLALINFGFLIALTCGHVAQRIFFGPLRANEVERLYDRLWFFITESLLAFTIFRDEFDVPFVLMFGLLLFVKSFHWLAGDRIEWMEQRPYPGPSLIFHIRMSTLFLILWVADFLMFLLAVDSTFANGVGGMVLFASEYGILLASVLNTLSKYVLSAYEFRRAAARGGENAPSWEHKSMWIFYIELATDFLKLATYLVFFTVIIAFYGLPLNIVRDVYVTARSFITRLRALHRYQTATRNMDQRYPSATANELTAMSDRTCIICREEMIFLDVLPASTAGHSTSHSGGPNTTPKKLPCGHIFHFHCLRSWLERQQSCPTCRRTVLDNPPDNNSSTGGQPAVPGHQPDPVGFGVHNRNQIPRPANNPFGPFGFIGRIFGGAQAQQVAPGPVQGDILQNINNPPRNAGNIQEVVIQYHVQYQPLMQQQQIGQQLLPLRPPPQFQGFTGPGGILHPWPREVPLHVDGPTVPGANDPITTSVTSSHNQKSSSIQEPNSQIGNSSAEGDNKESAVTSNAAALLRRQNNNGTLSSSKGTRTTIFNGPGSFTLNLDKKLTPSPSSSVDLAIPSLIPLYDYTSYNPSAPAQLFSTHANGTILSSPGHSHFSSSYPALRGGPSFSTNSSEGLSQPTRPDGRQLLPPVLNEEQLAVLDHLTRESIDERLRVLEGVSGAIHHCIEDLIRVRSVLPTLVAPTGSIVNSCEKNDSQSEAEIRSGGRSSSNPGKASAQSESAQSSRHM